MIAQLFCPTRERRYDVEYRPEDPLVFCPGCVEVVNLRSALKHDVKGDQVEGRYRTFGNPETGTVFVTFYRDQSDTTRVNTLGPAFSEKEDAVEWVAAKRKLGFRVAWVEIGLDDKDFAGYLL